ncbi:hypothetical protein BC830DRAFT_1063364 [Chytriomyces sp. MP71]|nr:hypothetical protein BC830DRAFT_1063364 [Chytriomyces sp. MP71]
MYRAPTTALLRHLSPSFEKCVTAVDLNEAGAIDMAKANAQHDRYAGVVKACVTTVIEVDADANHPDCCFIEDTLVVCGDVAVVNCLGHESRRGEVGPVRAQLEKVPTIKRVVNMANAEGSYIDGGDVLTMPHHQFVGLSKRSNMKGTLHLKCLISALDQSTIVVVDNTSGRAVFEEIQRLTNDAYKAIFVPDQVAANVLSFPWAVKPTCIIQASFPKSEEILRASIPTGWNIITLDMSELIKADGALTCCSVLI